MNKAKRVTLSGLPKSTDTGRKFAEDAMAPHLEEFQTAADEQTQKDLGIKPGTIRRRVKKLRKSKRKKKNN